MANTQPNQISAEEKETIRQAMSIMGRQTSEAKRRAVTANARLPRPGARKIRKPLSEIPCTCRVRTEGRDEMDHKTYCQRGRAIRYRQSKGLPLT